MSRGLALALVAFGLARAALGSWVGLGDAEAYYWTWAQRPAAGYLDHPPMIAWLVAASTAIGGDAPFWVRLPSALLFIGTLALVALLAADLGASSLAAVGLVALTPFLHIGGFGANPDVPLAFFGVAALLLARRGHALMAGAALGLALLSKASAVAYVPALAWLALRRPRLWLGAPVALVIAAPPLVWNALHGWPMLRFQLVERGASLEPLLGLARFAGGQLAYVTPPLLALYALALARAWRDPRDGSRFLVWAAAPAFVLGGAAALLYPSAEPHWTMPSFLPLAILAALPTARLPRRLVRASIAFSAAVLALFYIAATTPLVLRAIPARVYVGRFDLTNDLYGWGEVARALAGRPAAAAHYTMCAQLAYATGGAPVLCAAPRRSQFDFWPRPVVAGADVVFVSDERYPRRAGEALDCATITREPDVLVRRGGRIVRRFVLERCLGLRRLLLRQAVNGAKAPDEIDGVDADDLPPRKAAREDRQRDAVARIVEGRREHDTVSHVEVRVARRHAAAGEEERLGHGQFDDAHPRAPQPTHIVAQRLEVFVAAVALDRRRDHARRDEARDIVDVAVRVVAGDAAPEPDDAPRAEEVAQHALVAVAPQARVALLYIGKQALLGREQRSAAVDVDRAALEDDSPSVDHRRHDRHPTRAGDRLRNAVVAPPVGIFRPADRAEVDRRHGPAALRIAHEDRPRVAQPAPIGRNPMKIDRREIDVRAPEHAARPPRVRRVPHQDRHAFSSRQLAGDLRHHPRDRRDFSRPVRPLVRPA